MAALLVSIATGGRQGAAGLLRRLGPQGATWRTVAIAFVSWPLLVGGALAVTAVRDSALGSASAFSWRILPLAFVEVLLFTSIGEELGWRGFGLPVLLRRTRPAVATLAVGGIWAAWHLPLFWIPNTVQASIPLPYFVLSILAASALYTALFLHSQPSVLPALLMHTTQDVSLAAVQLAWPRAAASSTFWLAYFWLLVVLGVVTAFMMELRYQGARSFRTNVTELGEG